MKIGYYPDVVNENITRIVAGAVLCLTLVTIFSVQIWNREVALFLCGYLAAGFILRVLWGPKVEPFARIAAYTLQPRLGISYVPTAGPPKRFAQAIGVLFSVSAFITLAMNQTLYFEIILAVLAFFAFLESVFAFCAGCFVFSLAMKAGLIPEEVCERCNNLQLKPDTGQ